MIYFYVGIGVAIYVTSYFHFYAKKPRIYVKSSSKLQNFLSHHVPSLHRCYYPPFWCPEGRLQTIVRVFLPFNKQIKYRREIVPAPDGGQFYVDWFDNDDNKKYPDKTKRPTIFIVPGLTSTSKSNYVQSMVDILGDHGFRVMIIINRGLDGMEVLTPKAYCATHTMDMEVVIKIFKERYPEAPLFCIGISMGSLMLGRYMAQTKSDCKLVGAILHSCPFSPPHGTTSLERWENRILFNSFLTKGLKELYGKVSHMFHDLVDHEEVLQSKTIREYDSSFTSKVFGYDSVEEYYKDAVLTAEKLSSFSVPTLCVASDDDPFLPYDALPRTEVMETDNVALAVTYGGGHVSHMDGFNPFSKTYFEEVMEQFIPAVFEEVQ
ncbi:phospholipase ABHD3-like [Styela clava]